MSTAVGDSAQWQRAQPDGLPPALTFTLQDWVLDLALGTLRSTHGLSVSLVRQASLPSSSWPA